MKDNFEVLVFLLLGKIIYAKYSDVNSICDCLCKVGAAFWRQQYSFIILFNKHHLDIL